VTTSSTVYDMITAQQKEQLTIAGFEVENMGEVYGDEFAGQWRWLAVNRDSGELVDFQDDETSDSEEAAWDRAWERYSGR
jgi:hypothetical protein